MCYFLYGSINGGINTDDYEKVINNSGYQFNIGDKNDVNACVKDGGFEYRITLKLCDCDTPVGGKHTNKKGLKELEQLLADLRTIRGIKHIYISKNWAGETNEKEEIVHIDDIDVLHFFADVRDNCLYKIELYKKYYE